MGNFLEFRSQLTDSYYHEITTVIQALFPLADISIQKHQILLVIKMGVSYVISVLFRSDRIVVDIRVNFRVCDTMGFDYNDPTALDRMTDFIVFSIKSL